MSAARCCRDPTEISCSTYCADVRRDFLNGFVYSLSESVEESKSKPDDSPGGAPVRLLVISSDKYPPFRVDVSVLFGEELSAKGFEIDWILQSDDIVPRAFRGRWDGGAVWVGRTDTGASRFHRLRKHVLAFRHDLKVLRLARESSYDVIQVKDKVLAALPALWAARRNAAAFVYWLSFPHPEASTYVARIGAARYPLLYRMRGWVLFRLLYTFILPRA